MYGWVFVWLGWLVAWSSFPLSVEAQSSPRRSQLEIQHSDDVCGELTEAECCAQMLEIAVFRATGDHVPRGAKVPLRLSCKDPSRTIPENACRLIAMGRGLSAQDAADMCVPAGLIKRCASDSPCRQCMDDLGRLEWKGSARACYALTYLPKAPSGARVVTLGRRGR